MWSSASERAAPGRCVSAPPQRRSSTGRGLVRNGAERASEALNTHARYALALERQMGRAAVSAPSMASPKQTGRTAGIAPRSKGFVRQPIYNLSS
jgi:hypothetical protein